MDPIIFIGIFVVIIIFVLRLLGAWMLRINEVINLQEKILHELKKANASKGKQKSTAPNNA